MDEIKAFPFPDSLAEGRFDDAAKYIKLYKNDFFIIGDLELTMFEMSCHMVGLEKFIVDLAMGEPYVGALLDRVEYAETAAKYEVLNLQVGEIGEGHSPEEIRSICTTFNVQQDMF